MNMHDGRKFLPSGEAGWMDYWWLDDNTDGMIDYTELYWHQAANFDPYRVFDDAGNFIGDWNDAQGSFWGAYDYQNPSQITSPLLTLDESARSWRSREIGLSLEHELITDLKVGINLPKPFASLSMLIPRISASLLPSKEFLQYKLLHT